LFTTDDSANPEGGERVPSFANAKLTLPAGWKGRIRTPLIVQSIRGSGAVQLGQRILAVGSEELDAYLEARTSFDSAMDVLQVKETLEIRYLLNPKVYYLEAHTELELTGDNVAGMTVTLEDDRRH